MERYTFLLVCVCQYLHMNTLSSRSDARNSHVVALGCTLARSSGRSAVQLARLKLSIVQGLMQQEEHEKCGLTVGVLEVPVPEPEQPSRTSRQQ
eukprot:14761-Heterococcus_DN1.PRE.1